MSGYFKQTESLKDRIASFGRQVRQRASQLPPGKEKDDLLQKARLADMASNLDDQTKSSSLRPPK
jgi:hypothetical protein